jgi:hypothetical protein
MIFRRIKAHVVKEDWFAVFVDFLIVVFGVFMGFQVDGWKRAQNDRVLEQEYLIRLAGNIKMDIGEFTKFEEIYETKAKLINDLRDMPVAGFLSRHADTLSPGLDYTAWKALPKIQSATFSELAYSGNLSILRSETLRGALSDYYVDYQVLTDILRDSDGDYRKLFYGAIPGEMYLSLRLPDQPVDLERLDDALEKFKSEPGFEAAANAEMTYAYAMNVQLWRFRARAVELLAGVPQDTAPD